MRRALHVAAEKRGWQSLVAASNCNNSASRFYVMDQLTMISFLVDTGADLCVYPRSRLRERRTRTSYELFSANGTTVHTYVCITLCLDLGLRREFSVGVLNVLFIVLCHLCFCVMFVLLWATGLLIQRLNTKNYYYYYYYYCHHHCHHHHHLRFHSIVDNSDQAADESIFQIYLPTRRGKHK